LQLTILAITFTLVGIFLLFYGSYVKKGGLFYKPITNITPITTVTTLPVKYNVTEAHVWLGVDVSNHLIVGKKNATHMYFGGIPPGSKATGRIIVFVTQGFPVTCKITGNITKIATPTEFYLNATDVVEFELNLENTTIGEVYRGSFDCSKPL